MAHLALRLLGPLEILLDGQPVSAIKLAKARALLAYLAVEGERAHPRATLAGLLWPDYAESSALTSLRTALAMLRGALGDQEAERPFLLIDREVVRLNPQSDHMLDTAILDAIPIDYLASVSIASLQDAVDLYRGEFLEGLALDDCPEFEGWLSMRREHYRERVIEILHHLAERHLNDGDYRAADGCARRILALNPLDEKAHRQVMRALALAGRRPEALQQYESFAGVLAQELGVEPSPETRTLYESIRAGSRASSAPTARVVAERAPAELAAPSAPIAPLPPPLLHQLPPPPADFTGREEELQALTDAVQREGKALCGIRGPGGIGKTTLALVLAERLEEEYPDGQLYIEMRGTESKPLIPEEAMAQVVHACYPLAPLPEGEQALRASYRSALHGRRAILLLDNVRDRAQVEPLLAPPTCLLLITTRQHFALPGLHAVDLHVQPLAQAAQLLRAIAPRLEEEEAEKLAQACGQLPLALRVTGSALAEREDLPAEEYLQRLCAGREGLPTELEPVETSLELSDALLSETLRERWYALSVFPNTFDRAGAQAVWGLAAGAEAQDTAQDALSELLRYSLVDYNRETRRYRLHDLTRAYAAARLGGEAAEEVGARHAAHYAEVCQRSVLSFVQGLALFDRERANILVGQAWAAAHLDTAGVVGDQATQLCCDYAGDTRHLNSCFGETSRPTPQVLLGWCEAGLRAAQRLDDRRAEANCLTLMGALVGDHTPLAAIGHLEGALKIAREIGDRALEGLALRWLSPRFYCLGEVARAASYATQALAIAEEIDDYMLEYDALLVVGTTHYARREGHRALACHGRALQIVEDRHLDVNLGSLFRSLALDYHALGDSRRAVEYGRRGLTAAEGIGDRRARSQALYALGLAYTGVGEPERAIPYHEENIIYYREAGLRHQEGYNLYALGLATEAKGDDAQAIAQQEEALTVFREIGERRGQAQALWAMSQARERLGERGQAMELAEEALALYEAIEHPDAEVVREQLAQWRAAASG